MNLQDFLQLMPLDIAEQLIPAERALLMYRVSRKTRRAIAKMNCRVDVYPGKVIRQTYADEKATVTERRAAVRLFVGRSLQLSMTDFRIRSFSLHGMVLDQTGSLNAMLLHAHGLEILDLYNNHIDENAIGEVFDAIPSSLRVLKLVRQWINRAAVTPLCELLARLTLLEELDLSENYLNSSGMEALTTSIASARLARVSLGFNHLKSRFWNEYPQLGLDRFVLQKLDIRHNMLQAVFCDSVCLCIWGSAGALEVLDVSFNDLRLVGISYLSASLRKCRKLRHINIAGNLCGDAAFALLLAAIRPYDSDEKSMALESLDVAHNNLSSASARKFNRCMYDNPVLQQSLQSVSFSYNDLFDLGASQVIEALLPCAMRKLGLAEVVMGEAAGLCLAGTMLHWPMLGSLDVHSNCLWSTSMILIARAMSENESRDKVVVFTGNTGEDESCDEITRILSSTKTLRTVREAQLATLAQSRA